jgi:hypothetical protein
MGITIKRIRINMAGKDKKKNHPKKTKKKRERRKLRGV